MQHGAQPLELSTDPEKQQLVGRPASHASHASHARPAVGLAAALLAALLMAGYLLLGEYFMSNLDNGDPGTFLLGRQLIASLLMTLLSAARDGWAMPRRADRPRIHLLGLLNFVNAVGFVWGFKLTSAFTTSVMQLSIPVFTLFASVALREESLSFGKLCGVLLVVTGCGFVSVARPAEGGGGHITSFGTGLVVLVLQCFSFVGIMLLQKRVLEHYPVSLVVAWSYTLCTLWSLLYSAVDGSLTRLPEQFSSPSKVAIVVYSAVFGAVAYFELVAFATKHLPATLVAISVAFEPLAVSIAGLFFSAARTSLLELGGYVTAAVGTTVLALSYHQRLGQTHCESD
ncbi:hypothetical protein AB1Y20_004214 [Prymnesium parvum]|uniref:EamA domain-containing protein n=1 Tax=Prymnesium parvum TaxID=97485 RepID=A0AB34J634_PRYPA